MSHRDNFIKQNKELKKPMDIFDVGFVGAAGGSKPDQVTGAAVTADSTTELTVTWNAVTATPAVSGYKVERSPNGSSSWTVVAASQSGTSFGDSGLSVYTVYYYRVSAINSIGTGDPSSVVNARTVGIAPNQVTGLSASATSTSNINLSWSAASGGNPASYTYTVERSLNNSSWTSLGTTTSTSMSSGSLSTYTLYYYRVKASNAVGDGSYSSSANARTYGVVPNQVTGLSASAASATQINLSWSAATGGNPASYTYNVQSSPNNSSWTTLTNTGSTSYSNTGLTGSTLYYYRVRAYNAQGNGSYSSSASATTNAPPFSATGGTVTTSGLYTYHTFTSTSNLVVSGSAGNVEVVCIGAGGGGGNCFGGGGGGGGILKTNSYSLGVGTHAATVGSGGLRGSDGDSYRGQGLVGGNSSFDSNTAGGGGGGGGYAWNSTSFQNGSAGGNSGGSGGARGSGFGGGGGGSGGTSFKGGVSGTKSSNYNGGYGKNNGGNPGGGGGAGGGQAGNNAVFVSSLTKAGDGGNGYSLTSFPTTTTYSGGGGGSGAAYSGSSVPAGGTGGGGTGCYYFQQGTTDGTAYGAGGGAWGDTGNRTNSGMGSQGDGYQGVVIVRYLT
jgi:fibronectin type 3 domain-containing protein